MTDPVALACDHDEGCITCGDLAVPMSVIRVDRDRALAACVDEDGRRAEVEIGLVGEVRVGDHLLVHAGTALRRLTTAAP